MKIFFDLDGTIVDVSERYYRIYAELMTGLGLKPLDKSSYWEMKRERRPEEGITGLTGDVFRDYSERRIDKLESSAYLALDTLIPGSVETFSTLSMDHELFIVTMRKRRENLMEQISRLSITSYFSRVFSSSDSDPSEAKAAAVRSLGGSQGLDVIVGDTEADMRAGKAAGLRTCAVLSGIRSPRLLRLEEPDFVIDSIENLPGEFFHEDTVS